MKSLLLSQVLVLTAPAIAIAAFVTWHLYQSERDRLSDSLVNQARDIALVVDGLFGRLEATLQSLQTSTALKNGDLRSVDQKLRTISAALGDVPLVLSDVDGKIVLDTNWRSGEPHPEWPIWEPGRQAVSTGQSVITPMQSGRMDGRQRIAVVVPVRFVSDNHETHSYAVSISVWPEHLQTALHAIRLPAITGTFASILDTTGTVVSRTTDEAEWSGQEPTILPVVDTATRDGWIVHDFKLANGSIVLAAVARAPHSGFFAVIAVPQHGADGPVLYATLSLCLAGIVLLGMGVVSAGLIGRRILTSLECISNARHGSIPETGLAEVDHLGRRLNDKMVELEAAERAARADHALLASVISSTDDAVSVRDLNERFVIANGFAERMFASCHDGIVGKQIMDVLEPSLASDLVAADAEVIATRLPVTVERVWPMGGVRRTLQTTRAPWMQDGILKGIVSFARDVTCEREAEEKLRQFEMNLWHASRISSLGAMVAEMTHELGQPLSAASAYLSSCNFLIEKDRATVPLQLQLQIELLGGQITHASEIVTNIRRFARKSEVSRASVDVNAALSDAAITATRGMSGGFTGRIVFNLAPGLPRLRVNRTQMMQVVVNLVRNSIEAMLSSAGADDVIEIATDVVGDAVEISVSDTGPGMPADVIESPFRSFATSKPNGLGLGLSICKSIIEAHGGTITVASASRGTRVTARLPLNEATESVTHVL